MRIRSLSRRSFLQSALAGVPFAPGMARLFQEDASLEATEDNIEGPYYREGAPWRETLYEKGEKGDILVISGKVVARNGRSLATAEIEVWQANADGRYDNDDPDHPPAEDEFRLRGRRKTDGEGRYSFETIRPGRYKISATRERPAHIHLKVHHAGHRSLTTQLYFKDDKLNKNDPWFKASLAVDLKKEEKRSTATFNVVLARA